MVKQTLAMVVDASKCIDCKACMASCKVANEVPDGYWRNWIKDADPRIAPGAGNRQVFQPGGCMHCDKPICVSACPTGATYKDEDTGMVMIDRGLCIGCGNCLPACPYGARYRHPSLRVADKCNYCPERRANGLLPACVDTCPTKARVFGDINDPDSEASRILKKNQDRVVRIVNAQTDTKPNMYYLGKTSPNDWPVVAQAPTPMRALVGAANPVLKVLVGASALGVAALGAAQFVKGRTEKNKEERHG